MKKIRYSVFLFLVSKLVFSQNVSPPFKTGVNFPFRSPETTTIADFLLRLNQTNAPAMRQMTFADVYWGQVESNDNVWDFSRSDSAYFNSYGIIPVGELFTINGPNDSIGIQVPWEACYTNCLPNNPSHYWDASGDSLETKDYVQTVINRYRAVTRFWEIANEFENTSKPKGLSINGSPSPAQVEFLGLVRNWIKSTDSQAQVLLPGMLGTYGYPMSNTYDWLRGFLQLGGGETFDIMNYHDYNSWWTLPLHYDSIQAVLTQAGYPDKPIWITETAISSVYIPNVSSITPSYATIDEQAADVWRRISLLWAKGAQVVFWHSLWSSGDFSGWGEFGLLNQNGNKKKSFHAYRLLVEKALPYDSVQIVQTGIINDDNTNGGDGVWVLQFWQNTQPRWLIWSPNNLTYTLTGINNASHLKITHVVPTVLLMNGDSAVFQIDTVLTQNGNYTFTNLSSLPLWVEPILLTSEKEISVPKSYSQIYPSIAKEYVVVDVDMNNYTVVLLSYTGKKLKKIERLNSKYTLNLLGIPKGVYLVKVYDEKSCLTQKIIKQ